MLAALPHHVPSSGRAQGYIRHCDVIACGAVAFRKPHCVRAYAVRGVEAPWSGSAGRPCCIPRKPYSLGDENAAQPYDQKSCHAALSNGKTRISTITPFAIS